MIELVKDENAPHMPVTVSSEQERNLRKLAAYLAKKVDPERFGMASFVVVTRKGEGGYEWTEELDFGHAIASLEQCKAEEQHNCGSVGCALGHGPLAGIGMDNPDLKDMYWDSYSQQYFGLRNGTDAWTWCFGGQWFGYDNTPTGAAKRILYMLKFGYPVRDTSWAHDYPEVWINPNVYDKTIDQYGDPINASTVPALVEA